jgi:site-specific recombinase XerD
VVLDEHYVHRIPEFDLALNTGMRQSEQYQWISRATIDFENRVLTVPKTKYGPARHIPLNDAAIAAFQQILKYGQGNDILFLNRYGEKLSKPREWFERAVKLANITNFRWHDLRHTFASRLVMAGVDLRTVQELMGHQTIQMTVRYAHLAPTHTLAAVQRLCDTNLAHSAGATTSATGAYGSASAVQ